MAFVCKNTPLYWMNYHAKFDRSWSNEMSVGTGSKNLESLDGPEKLAPPSMNTTQNSVVLGQTMLAYDVRVGLKNWEP